MNLTYREMYQMRMDGKSYQEIADASGVSRQRVNYVLIHYNKSLKGMRGKGFNIENIHYKGLYEYFKDNMYESITSFTKKVHGNTNTKYITGIRNLLTGRSKNPIMTLSNIKKMCEITGRSFEELFELREGVIADE